MCNLTINGNIMNKKCPKCSVIKSLKEFHKRGGGRKGYASYCKECANETTKKFFKTEKGRAAQKRANQSDAGKAARKKYDRSPKGIARIQRRRQSEKYRQRHREANRRYQQRHRQKINAQSAVRYAVKTGKIKPAVDFICSLCKMNNAIEYHHHKGYDKINYLDIVPACKRCHTNAHR